MGFSVVRPVTVTDAVLTASNVTESETLWNSGTTYALNAVVYRIIDNVHQRFVSLQNSNLNRIPEAVSSSTWWQATGATNRWACFDDTVGSLTTRADTIAMTLALPSAERADTLYLAGLSASTVRAQVTDPLAGAIYDRTISLVEPGGVTDWYSYFMEPVRRAGELVLTDLPPGAGSTLTLTLTDTGATVAVGFVVLGFSQSLGVTKWGAQLGIRDYSVKADDAFGNQFVLERAFRKKANFSVVVDNRLLDTVIATLATGRAALRLYIGSGDYTSTVVLGFFKDFSVEMSLPPNRSLCSLELESIA
jgi:hypothetical protein